MRKIVFVVLSLIPVVAFADIKNGPPINIKKLPITADVGICAHRNEVNLNTGKNSRIRIKGNEHYYLFNFDTKQIRTEQIRNRGNWKITKATLHIKLARGHLRKVAFCTVPSEWVEGTAVNKKQKGSTCFTHLKYPDKPWTQPGGTMLDATFNSPYMLWKSSDVKTGKNGWLEIPIAPELIQAVAVGLSHGLVMSDEKGQTRENHDVYTREQANAKPYITVEGHIYIPLPKPWPPPPMANAKPFLQGADFNSGAIIVSANLPNRVLANKVRLFEKHGGAGKARLVRTMVSFRRRELVFAGLRPGKKYLVHLNSYHINGGWSSTQNPPTVTASPALTIPKAPKTIRPDLLSLAGMSPGWSFLRRYACEKASADLKGFAVRKPTAFWVSLTPRNAWAGTQVVILPLGGKAENVSVSLKGLGFMGKTTESVPPLKHVKLYRIWYVPKDKKHHAEVLVPLKSGEKFSIPWVQNKVPNQANQAIFVDVWVPKNAVPGPYEGSLAVLRNGEPVMTVPIKIQVAGVTLPDKFNIVGDMNAYSSPARAMGVKHSDPKAFMEMERKYYRLAHSHRMTLNVLPYSQSGSVNWRGAPKIAGKGDKCKVIDWSQWDERFGPLLSGEAFTKKHGYLGPGEGVPIHHMYLPFHENWPAKLAEHFKPWPPPKDYQKFLKWTADLPSIEKCFGMTDAPFGPAWHMVLRQFTLHTHHKKWNRTRYQVYLNNKYYFRNREKGFGRGISLWLLDEPMFTDDFLALRYFGRLTRGMAVGDIVPFDFDFRIDISRPGFQRNWLDGVVDLNVCAGQLYKQRRLIAYRKRKFGEEYWNYKMPPSFTSSNLAWTLWPVRSYCWGATGTLPWQTIASDGDLTKADATALMYPGRKFGLNEPVPSLRMKAWRDGIQTAELLRMLKIKMKWNDIQLRAFVGQVCNLDGWKDGPDPEENSSIVTFKRVIPGTLAKLKRATILMLSKK